MIFFVWRNISKLIFSWSTGWQDLHYSTPAWVFTWLRSRPVHHLLLQVTWCMSWPPRLDRINPWNKDIFFSFFPYNFSFPHTYLPSSTCNRESSFLDPLRGCASSSAPTTASFVPVIPEQRISTLIFHILFPAPLAITVPKNLKLLGVDIGMQPQSSSVSKMRCSWPQVILTLFLITIFVWSTFFFLDDVFGDLLFSFLYIGCSNPSSRKDMPSPSPSFSDIPRATSSMKAAPV